MLIVKLFFFHLRKKKQDEEEAEQKRKATETAYQGRYNLCTLSPFVGTYCLSSGSVHVLDHVGIYCENDTWINRT